MDAARQRALLALFGNLVNGGGPGGAGVPSGGNRAEPPVTRAAAAAALRPRPRERVDHVHDPPRAVRLQRRAMARSELAADVRRRCSDARLAVAPSGVGGAGAGGDDAVAGAAADAGSSRSAPPPPLAALLRRRESSAAAARDARLLTTSGSAFAPNKFLAAFRGGARDRVYNCAFSASGRYLVAAWQDESIRIYDTALGGAGPAADTPDEAAAAAAAKVAGGWREAVRVQARNVTWTVSSTDTSPDERSVLYTTLNSTVHLLRLSDPAAAADGSGAAGWRGGGGTAGTADNYDDDDDEELEGAPGSPASPRGGARYSSLATPRSPYTAMAAAEAAAGGARAGERSFRAAGGGGGGGGGGRAAGGDFGVSAHEALDFSRMGLGAEAGESGLGAGGGLGRRGRGGGGSNFGIFSARFSRGGGEIVAGCNDGVLRIFDIERGVVSESVRAHGDDINSVCFAGGAGDAADTVVSGSDERLTPLKIWDRRALGRPVGVLLGHRGGITHVAPRGDGVHVLSAGKDQTIKIWDRRRAGEASGGGGGGGGGGYGGGGGAARGGNDEGAWLDFDYRWEGAAFERGFHPRDASLLTLHGPSIQQTLIRAHFSPLESTGGRFVYSGSADGVVYVFEALTGALVRQLRHHRAAVRDVSWHPTQPLLAAASWDGELSLFGFGAEEAVKARRAARSWRVDAVGVRARNHAERRRLAAARSAIDGGGGGSGGGEGGESSDEDLGDDEELRRVAAVASARGASGSSAGAGSGGDYEDDLDGGEGDEEEDEDEDGEDEVDADDLDEEDGADGEDGDDAEEEEEDR